MARIIHSTDILCDATARIESDSIHYTGGSLIAGLPALYDKHGHFVEVVNLWFLELKTVRHLIDINSSVRALLRYWSFLEKENLSWDTFPPLNRLKPTYAFRNTDLLAAVNAGQLARTTANTYMGHVVQFYIWAIENHHLIVSDEKAAPFTLEFTTRTNRGLLAHLHPRIIVQTSDLRIRLPRNSNAIPLTPLTKAHLTTLSRYLKHEPVEFILMVLLACDSGLRLREVCSFTLDALMQARTACASGTRFQLTISPMNGVDTKFKKKERSRCRPPCLPCYSVIPFQKEGSTGYQNFRIRLRHWTRLTASGRKIGCAKRATSNLCLSVSKVIVFSQRF